MGAEPPAVVIAYRPRAAAPRHRDTERETGGEQAQDGLVMPPRVMMVARSELAKTERERDRQRGTERAKPDNLPPPRRNQEESDRDRDRDRERQRPQQEEIGLPVGSKAAVPSQGLSRSVSPSLCVHARERVSICLSQTTAV